MSSVDIEMLRKYLEDPVHEEQRTLYSKYYELQRRYSDVFELNQINGWLCDVQSFGESIIRSPSKTFQSFFLPINNFGSLNCERKIYWGGKMYFICNCFWLYLLFLTAHDFCCYFCNFLHSHYSKKYIDCKSAITLFCSICSCFLCASVFDQDNMI